MLRFLSCFSVFFALFFTIAPLHAQAQPSQNPQQGMTREEKIKALQDKKEMLQAKIQFAQDEANQLMTRDFFGSQQQQQRVEQLQQELDAVNAELDRLQGNTEKS